MAKRYEYNTENERLKFIASANEQGLKIAEIPEEKFFYVLEPWEEWNGAEIEDKSDEYVIALKARKIEALHAFISGKIAERIYSEYGVSLNFDEPLTVNKILGLVLQSGMTLEEIYGKTQTVYVEFTNVFSVLKAQIDALSTILELNEYDIEAHYDEIIVNTF